MLQSSIFERKTNCISFNIYGIKVTTKLTTTTTTKCREKKKRENNNDNKIGFDWKMLNRYSQIAMNEQIIEATQQKKTLYLRYS